MLKVWPIWDMNQHLKWFRISPNPFNLINNWSFISSQDGGETFMHKLGKNKTRMSMITHQMDGEGEGKISYFNMITSRTYISSEMDIKTVLY